MTERDELISAYVDGDATPDERARVEADPSMLADVDQFRAIALQVAADDDPGAADPFTRRRHLGAALAAFDDLGGDATEIDLRPAAASATSAEVDDSAIVADVVAMARPDRRRRPLGALVAAAAGVVMLVGVAVPLTNGSDDDSSLATASLEDSADDAGDAGDAARSMEASSVEAEEMESFAADDDAMADEAMEEEVMEEEVMEEAAAAESVEEAGEADTSAADTGAGGPESADAELMPDPVVVDLERRAELFDEMLARWENDVASSEPACPLREDRFTLHVAPGRSDDGSLGYELQLHALDADGAGFETTVLTLPECSPALR